MLVTIYYRIPESELLEDYLKAVDLLTIGVNSILRERLTEVSEDTSRAVEAELQKRGSEIQLQDQLRTDAIANLADQILEMQKEIDILKKRDISKG